MAAGRDLGDITARAKILVDELSVMVSAGDNIAMRIEGVVNDVRRIGAQGQVPGKRMQ